MHVEDSVVPCTSTHGHNNSYKIHVYNSIGEGKCIETTGEILVCKLQVALISALYPDKKGCQYKLVSLSKRRTLSEGLTLRDEGITENEILLLLPPLNTNSVSNINHITSASSSSSSSTSNTNCLQAREISLKGPTEIEIWSATANLQAKNLTKLTPDTSVTLDFQKELRKILVSLIDFTVCLLKNDPEVRQILAGISDNSDGKSNNDSEKGLEDEVNKVALEQLVDMGFSAEKARRALILNNMSPLDAMDWLLAYESTQMPMPPAPSTANAFTSADSSGSSSVSNFTPRPGSSKVDDYSHHLPKHPEWVAYYDKVPAIVESYRSFKRKSFRPNTKALNNLKKMGFHESLVMDALWIHTNNEVAACEWLLSDRRPCRDDLRRGLSTKSPIYKAIISDATIQLGLLKPRILYSLLQLLEEPNSMGRLLNDAETSPVLSQIFRIYNSEKHLADSGQSSPSSSSSPVNSQETLLQENTPQAISLQQTSLVNQSIGRENSSNNNSSLSNRIESDDPAGHILS